MYIGTTSRRNKIIISEKSPEIKSEVKWFSVIIILVSMNKMTVEVCVCRQERVFYVAWCFLWTAQKTHKPQEWKSLLQTTQKWKYSLRRFKEYQHRMQNSFRTIRKPHQNNKPKKQSTCGLKFAYAWLFLSSRNTVDRYLQWNDALRTCAWWDCAYLRNTDQPEKCFLCAWCLHVHAKGTGSSCAYSRVRGIGRGHCMWGLQL